MNTLPAVVNRLLAGFGVQVVRTPRVEASLPPDKNNGGPSFNPRTLPPGALETLHYRNPRLIELKERYRNHASIQHSVWNESYLGSELNLPYFRGDNAYVWQERPMATDKARPDPLVQYALTTYYVREIDRLGLLDRFEEDGLFGALTFRIADRLIVSRDVLDSILELSFLERQLRISQMPSLTWLDIGAGYGRLGYRLATALPNLKAAFCTDAVAESTFLCEYYLKFRGVADKVKAVPIDEIEQVLQRNSIDIATNIESFSECTAHSIIWWLDLIQKYRVKYLMIVPNYRDHLVSAEADGSKIDFRPLVEARGFELIATEPVYEPHSCVSIYGVYPDRAHLLFRNTQSC